ncbi:transcription factor TFIIE beta subunit, TFIIEB, Tfa2 [Polyrhizophydium stewartii]|uniref:Transcription factor TFIIE beta subunit, TFIIEB, Tfa2 n=1 Tax=Polyrhizophydium stewartii TaxID=2732419 RepID=A0ABR4MYK3_9FUNG
MESSKAEMRQRMLAQPIIKKRNIAQTPNEAGRETIEVKNVKRDGAALPLYSSDYKTVSQKLFDLIQLLRAEERPLTNNDIIRKLAMDVSQDEQLLAAIIENQRIHYDPRAGTLEFKPQYRIKCKEDLLALLKASRGISVMEVKELRESCNSLQTYIDQLLVDREILVVPGKDGLPRVLYYNDVQMNVKVSQEFQDMWNTLPPPPEMDLPKELEKAGLKSMEVIEMKKEQTKAKAKARRKARFRLTNTHLEGVDLTQEYVPT